MDIYKNLPARDELRISSVQIGGAMTEEDQALFPDAEVCALPGYAEINPKGITKATGLIYLEKEFGVAHEDIIVFGDSENDLDMLLYAETSVVMNHSPEQLWKYATLRTDSEENGVAEGIEKLLFL